MKILFLITISIYFSIINNAFAFCSNDSTKNYFHEDESVYLKKLELIKLSNTKPTFTLSTKINNRKTAQILRIAALPFFVAALIANNSREWSRSFLIAGAGIELTSIYYDLRDRKVSKISSDYK